jgi:hypothetical protein
VCQVACEFLSFGNVTMCYLRCTQLLQKESFILLLMDNPSINFFSDRVFKLLAFRCLNL